MTTVTARLRIGAVALSAMLGTAGAVRAGPLPEAAPEDVGISSPRLERLTRTMQQTVDNGELAGVVVPMRRANSSYQSLRHAGQGQGLPMATGSIFRIYSMTNR
jgi:CubicO group peptidase (beta-lactamase class C family)